MRAFSAAASILLILALAGTSQAGPKEDALELLEMWDPAEILMDGCKMTVALNEDRVTDVMYLAVLTAGLCLGPLLDMPLESVTEVHVLSRNKSQGYVYEKGLEDGDKFNNPSPGDKSTKLQILSATHLY
ncbi:hypothetical protein [Roseovarius arcticus]|uniref:hypothetical protein n=1 Tax=Roseovarius arcticus TaxID=2547404 RepID=UPI001110D8F4|nr:hypothetical protein [Roseovarius arcticus]